MNTTANINFIGSYRFRKTGHRHSGAYWQSNVSFKGDTKSIIDAAGIDSEGKNIVNLIPYKENLECPEVDKVMQDGDLLAYVMGPMDIGIPANIKDKAFDNAMLEKIGGILKGRASHAEIGYSENGLAYQVSLWGRPGPMAPEERRFFRHACADTISIYRPRLSNYGVDSKTERMLKAEVKRWKTIVQPVYFPVGQEMNIDPADFTTLEELKFIASGFLNHSPADTKPAFDFKLNCVQWSTLVFSLAVCYPLSRRMLDKCGMLEAYAKNWAAKLGYADDSLLGIEELPIPFYTMEEIIENTLDMYFPESKAFLLDALKILPLQQILTSRGVANALRVMPNAFVLENRLRGLGVPRKTKTIFEYIATAAPANELEEMS